MNPEELFDDTNGREPLPEPTATLKSSDDGSPFTEAELRGMLCNPIYAGLGPFPPYISDERWIRNAAKLIREEGVEQFLVNLLHILKMTFPPQSA